MSTPAQFQPDSDFIVTASSDSTGQDLGPGDGRGADYPGRPRGGVTACAISPNSDFVVTASTDYTCKIWTRDSRERATLVGHAKVVTACAISPNSDFRRHGEQGPDRQDLGRGHR